MRLRLCQGHQCINAIYFSATPESVSVEPGDLVDVAFQPQINEFRGERTVQMNVCDIRPSCSADCSADTSLYRSLRAGTLNTCSATALCPDRTMLGIVWRYLAALGRPVQEAPMCLCRKIVRWSDNPMSLGQMMTCLDIFAEVGLLRVQRQHKYITIELTPGPGKADLTTSQTMQQLLRGKES